MNLLFKKGPSADNVYMASDPSKPQAPLNGYMRFCSEVRGDRSLSQKYLNEPDHTKLTVVEAGKALSAAWKGLSDAEKKPYHDAYEQDKVGYVQELDAWKAQQASA